MSLGQNARWKKVMSDAPEFTFADIVMKVNRTNGKVKSLYLRYQSRILFLPSSFIIYTFQIFKTYISFFLQSTLMTILIKLTKIIAPFSERSLWCSSSPISRIIIKRYKCRSNRLQLYMYIKQLYNMWCRLTKPVTCRAVRYRLRAV